MKTRSRKTTEGTTESPDKKLSRLIEKLNAELKVMNEIKPETSEDTNNPAITHNPESPKRKSNLKPKQS